MARDHARVVQPRACLGPSAARGESGAGARHIAANDYENPRRGGQSLQNLVPHNKQSGAAASAETSRGQREEVVVVHHEPDQHHHRDKQKVHPRLRGRGGPMYTGGPGSVMLRPAAQCVQRHLLMTSRW
jgi:hypothetical protein